MAGEQYSEEVRVIDVPGVSMELCGGTHVTTTAQIGVFKILSESGIASGTKWLLTALFDGRSLLFNAPRRVIEPHQEAGQCCNDLTYSALE